MTIQVHLKNKSLMVESVKMSFAQNTIGECEFTVPYAQVIELGDLYLAPVRVYKDTQLLFDGFVSGKVKPSFDKSGYATATISCFDQLGRLACKRSKQSGGHYQNVRVIDIIYDLLDLATTDWRYWDISTLQNVFDITTIDLRTKETRWAQLVELVNSVPLTFMRYGGFDGGTNRYCVDVGAFGANTGLRLVDGMNVTQIKQQESEFERIRSIEAFGGFSGDEVITLYHALQYDPTLATHPDYPITFDGLGYIVNNNSVAVGCEVTKQFSLNRTADDSTTAPTDVEKFEAGYALWVNAVRELQKAEPQITYEVTAYLDEMPRINDMLYLRGQTIETVYDRFTHSQRTIRTFQVDGLFRLLKYDIKADNSCLEFDLTLSTGDYLQERDTELELYDLLANQNNKFKQPVVAPTIVTMVVDEREFNIASDCTYTPLGTPGKVFTIPTPTPSITAASVEAIVSTIPAGIPFEVIQNVSLSPVADLQICLSPLPGGWTLLSDVTARVTFIFSS